MQTLLQKFTKEQFEETFMNCSTERNFGAYTIYNKIVDKKYHGSSKDVIQRIKNHIFTNDLYDRLQGNITNIDIIFTDSQKNARGLEKILIQNNECININNVRESLVRFKAEEIKKALFNNNHEVVVKKATKIGSSIYLNVTGIIENNTFYRVVKEGDKIVLTKIDVEELLRV